MQTSKKDQFERTEALLYNVDWIKMGIKNMEEDLKDEIKEMSLNDGVGSVDPGAECIKTNKINSTTESIALYKVEGKKAKVLKERIEASKELIKKIELVVSKLKDSEQEIIRLYYFEQIKNDRLVAEKANYSSPAYVGKLRRKAVSRISIGLGHSISSECKIYRVS